MFPKLLPSIFESDIVQKIKDLYYRYIDDGITVLPMNVPPLLFLSTLNNMHCSIQFTITNSTLTKESDNPSHTINFLDIKIIISQEGFIKTDVFYKDTNAHDYLHFDSHHPLHIKKNIPYILAKRIIGFTSDDLQVQRNLKDLRKWLVKQKYPHDVIEKGIRNASLQGPANKVSNDKIIPLITPYVKNYDNSNTVEITRNLIGQSKNPRIKLAFTNTKFIQSYKQIY